MANPSIMTVIELTDTHVKLFQSQLIRGKRQITACEARSLQRFTDDEVSSLLMELTRSKTIASEQLTLVISRRLVIVKSLKLPSQNIHEIKKMLSLQLGGLIPYGMEDIVYDFQITNKDSDGYSYLSVYIVHKELVQRYLRYMGKLNLHPARLTVSSAGVLNFFTYLTQEKLAARASPILVVNVDLAHSEILFINDGNISYSRHVAFGSKDLSAENVGGLAEQIRTSLAKYEKDHLGPSVNKIYLVSSLDQTQLLKQSLQGSATISVETETFMEKIPVHKNVNLSGLQQKDGVSLIAGLGLVLLEPKLAVNLTPSEVHQGKQARLLKRQVIQCVVACSLLLALVLVMSGLSYFERQWELQRIEGELQSMAAQRKAVEQRQEQLDALRMMINNRVYVPEILAAIYELTPAEVSYRTITLNEQGQLTLQGYCENSAGVNVLQTQLIRSAILSNVNLQFATKRKIFNMDVTDFKINAQLKQRSDQQS